jgi:hypothetical protein
VTISKGNIGVRPDGSHEGGGATRAVYERLLAAQAIPVPAGADGYSQKLQLAGLAATIAGVLDFLKIDGALPTPFLYSVLGSIDASTWIARYEGYPIASVAVPFSLGAGSVDRTLFTVPALPIGAGRLVVSRFFVRLSTALGGSDTGTVAVRLGTSVGGNQLMTDRPVDKLTALGIIGGLSIATYGASLLAANAYEATLAAGDVIRVRATTTGSISAGAATAYLYGWLLP